MTTIISDITTQNYWCGYCRKPTTILSAQTKYPAELMHFEVPYHFREHACEFEVVQCRYCKAEGLIVYGADVKHWRKTPRWWSDLDGRIELAGSKRTGPTPIINVINEFKSLSSQDRIEFLLSPHNWSSLKPQRIFEFCIGAQFQLNGYEVKNIGGPRDRGIDITASKSDSTIAIQCKRWNKHIPPGPVRDFAGALLAHQQIKRGIIVSIGDFTSEAIDAARRTRDKSILLVNGQGLLFMLMNFPRFEEEYLTKYQVKTAFSGPPPTRVAVSPQRGLIKHVCLVALRAIPDQKRPEVGKGGKHGYFLKRVRKDGRVRYYCLHTISGKVHEGSCEFNS